VSCKLCFTFPFVLRENLTNLPLRSHVDFGYCVHEGCERSEHALYPLPALSEWRGGNPSTDVHSEAALCITTAKDAKEYSFGKTESSMIVFPLILLRLCTSGVYVLLSFFLPSSPSLWVMQLHHHFAGPWEAQGFHRPQIP
jgi:hypothetical protein